jgi:hypothetical protein
MYNNREYQKTYLATGATTQIFTGRGVLQAITINTTAAATITIIDGTSGSTANVAILKASIVEGTYWFNCVISSGLRIILGGASDVTVTWSQG